MADNEKIGVDENDIDSENLSDTIKIDDYESAWKSHDSSPADKEIDLGVVTEKEVNAVDCNEKSQVYDHNDNNDADNGAKVSNGMASKFYGPHENYYTPSDEHWTYGNCDGAYNMDTGSNVQAHENYGHNFDNNASNAQSKVFEGGAVEEPSTYQYGQAIHAYHVNIQLTTEPQTLSLKPKLWAGPHWLLPPAILTQRREVLFEKCETLKRQAMDQASGECANKRYEDAFETISVAVLCMQKCPVADDHRCVSMVRSLERALKSIKEKLDRAHRRKHSGSSGIDHRKNFEKIAEQLVAVMMADHSKEGEHHRSPTPSRTFNRGRSPKRSHSEKREYNRNADRDRHRSHHSLATKRRPRSHDHEYATYEQQNRRSLSRDREQQ